MPIYLNNYNDFYLSYKSYLLLFLIFRAYWGFADHFRDEADKLLNSLDPSYKKMLQGEIGMSNSSSSQSLHNSQKTSGMERKNVYLLYRLYKISLLY